MKPICDITQQEGYQHVLRDRPTQQTNPEAEYKAKSNQQSYPQSHYLKSSATSKADYTNTQQGLPVIRYTLVRYLDMQGFAELWVCLAEKQ